MLTYLEVAGLTPSRVPEVAGLTPLRAEDPYRRYRHRVPSDRPSLARLFVRAGQTLAGVVRAIAAWQERRRLVHRLSSLDDRLLADIGIERVDIPEVARGKIVREAPVPFVAWQRPRQVQRVIKGRRPAANDAGKQAAA